MKNGVAIYGGFAGNETNLNRRKPEDNLTVLSGDIDGGTFFGNIAEDGGGALYTSYSTNFNAVDTMFRSNKAGSDRCSSWCDRFLHLIEDHSY